MQSDRFYLELALHEADVARQEGTYPIGAVIVDPDGAIVSKGHNRVYSVGDYTAHAEIDAIRRAGGTLMAPSYFTRCTMYTSLEPCLMCSGALLLANIARVVWAANDPDYGALHNTYSSALYPELFASIAITAAPEPDLALRSQKLMEQWIQDASHHKQRWKEVTTPQQKER